MLDLHCLTNLVYIGTSISIGSRICFGIVLLRNRSTNPISLTICVMNIASNAFWTPYALETGSRPILIRSIADMIISAACGAYIVYNLYNRARKIESTRVSDAIENGCVPRPGASRHAGHDCEP